MTEIVKIDPADFGLEVSKAAEIQALFTPMLDKMTELEAEYNTIIVQEPSYTACEEAKKLRLKYVKIRTGTAAIHKDAKAFYLAGGRFVDGWKNAQLFASQGIEEKLKALEDYYENKARAERLQLKEERLLLLEPYEEETEHLGLDQMSEEVWLKYYKGVQAAATEKDAEAELESQRLKNEAKKVERINRVSAIGMVWIEVLDHYEKDSLTISRDEILNFTEEEFEIQFKFIEGKLAKIAAVNAKIEVEEKRIQDELQAKIDNAAVAKASQEAKLKALAYAPDKEKLLAFSKTLYALNLPEVSTEEAQEVVDKIENAVDRIIEHIIEKANQL